ncbi:MAG TPA: GNAT family protein [Chloroflexia bacterium]|jgi:RimJ/RimL family protein N-acetyltransferase
MHADALYVHDENNRLVRVNEPDPDDPAPRFFLFRTTSGNIWRTRCDLPAALTAELNTLAASEPVVPDALELREPPYRLADYTELLKQHAPVSSTYAGPAYYLPELGPPAGTVTIADANLSLLEAHYPYTKKMHAQLAPVVVRVVGGVAVAVCSSARRTAQVAEAGVHTVEAYRGRGYAAEIVRGWAAGARATRRLPLYSTWWENKASQAVAARLGAVLYGVDFSIT